MRPLKKTSLHPSGRSDACLTLSDPQLLVQDVGRHESSEVHECGRGQLPRLIDALREDRELAATTFVNFRRLVAASSRSSRSASIRRG